MPEIISKAEKLELLLALSLIFERSENDEVISAVQISEKFARKAGDFLQADEKLILRKCADYCDDLPIRSRELWQTRRLDKIKRRGRLTRLDKLIHPSQIVRFLKSEPKNIQTLIIQNLPTESQLQIAAELKIKSARLQNAKVQSEVLQLIRQHFLRHFVAFEDIFEAIETDKFSHAQMTNFVLLLGIRETAIACRGIKSKESLAVFLNRFDKTDAHEIAGFITQLEKIKPFWVVEADRLMREIWTNNINPHDFLKTLGLKLFALAYSDRDLAARKFAAQKMTVAESEKWLRFLQEIDQKFDEGSEEENQFSDKRRKIIKRLAVKFEQTQNL